MIDRFVDGIRQILNFGPLGQVQPAQVGSPLRATAAQEYGPAASAVNGLAVANSTNPVLDVLYAQPFTVPTRGGTVRKLTVGTAGAGSTFRFGIYKNVANPNDPYPGKLLFDTGSVVSVVGDNQIVCNVPLDNPLHGIWAVYLASVSLINYQVVIAAQCTPALGIAENATTAMNRTIEKAFTYAALPDPFPSGGTWNTAITSLVFKFGFAP
jgi:hypothetical protein